MATSRKFLFDTSFDDVLCLHEPPESEPESEPEPETPLEPTFSQDQLIQAHEDGYRDGFAAGRQAAESAATARLAAVMETAERRLSELIERSEREAASRHEEAVRIGLAIARKLLPAAARRHGLAEIEAMLTACVAEMIDAPRLMVRVSEADLDAVAERLDAVVAAGGFAGKVALRADAGLSPGDCLVEWPDGGVERKTEQLWQEIERIADRALAATEGPIP